MPKLGEKRGVDGKYYMPEPNRGEQMEFEAPAIHSGTASPKRKYYFENRQQPGVPLSFFAGNAPVKGNEPSENDVKQYHLEHGTEVELTEEMAEHIRSKGTWRPVQQSDGFGMKSEKKFLDRRFDLHEV